MGGIRSSIELQDNFTSILYQVIASVNLGLSAMEDLHQTMNAPVDTASIDQARASIDQATAAVRLLDEAIQGVEAPAVDMPSGAEAPVVDIPVAPQWQTDNLNVFASSGAERFAREVQSADRMLNTLNTTQQQIARTAAQTDLFPESAAADLSHMQDRLLEIQQRIHIIEGNPLNLGSDIANAGLEQLRGQLDQAVREQENLNRAVENMDAQAANEAYLRLSRTVSGTERYIRDNVDEQGRFNQEIRAGNGEAGNLMQTIKGAVAAYATIHTLSVATGLSDELTSTTARLNLMNDGLQTTEDLQNMIYLSAERARGGYQATADAVSKLGLMAGDAFNSSEEIIAFMEQINKQFRIAGTETAGIDAAMLQLTQAMGSGVLRGEEYNSILEQAPNIIQNIAGYIEQNGDVLAAIAAELGMKTEDLAGNVQGNLKDIASEGLISAELVKAAMFAAADETNEKFESMPMTFEQIGTSFQNTALMVFQPVLERMNEIANSEAFQGLVDRAIESLSVVAGVALEVFNSLVGAANLIADNWSWISPIIYGVAGALAVYYGWQFAVNMINTIGHGIHFALAAAQTMHAAATGGLTAVTAANIAAQHGLNAAMYACPITWILLMIIALIAAFYAVVAAVNKFAGTSVSATGIICGVFMVAAAFVGNLFAAVINFLIDLFVMLWNFIAAFANFFGNVFTDPVGAIARLFYDLVDTVLSLLESLASAIDTVFGGDLAGSVHGWRDSLAGMVEDTFGKGTEVMEQINAEDWHLGRFEYGSAWNLGYNFGKGIDESIANFDPSSLFDSNIPDPGDYADLGNYSADFDGLGGIGSGVNDIAGNTGAIKDTLDITEEDLRYLRDIAEQEAINRFTTAEIKIEQTNHNTVSGTMDLDGVLTGLTDAVNEAADRIAEGVHV